MSAIRKQSIPLIAAAATLPLLGYLLGFTKSQETTPSLSAETIEYDFNKLPPETYGVILLANAKEWGLTQFQIDDATKQVRKLAAELPEIQKKEWQAQREFAMKLYEGTAIIPTSFYHDPTTYDKESVEAALRKHTVDVATDLPAEIREKMNKKLNAVLSQKHTSAAHFRLLFDPATVDALHLTSRQKNQLFLLKRQYAVLSDMDYSVQQGLVDRQAGKGDALSWQRLDEELLGRVGNEQAEKLLKRASPMQLAFFYTGASGYLDPLQMLKLTAMMRDRTYVPVP